MELLPRNVIILASHFPGGGVQEVLTDLAKGLTKKGFNVRLLALYPLSQAAGAPQVQSTWSYVVKQKPKSIGDLIGLLLALLNNLRASAPFAVVSAMPAANVLAIFAARLAAPRARVIITHHSPVDTHNPLLNFADGWLGTWRNVTAVICVSNVVSASLAGKPRSYIAKRSTIHNALPPRLEELLSLLAPQRNRSRAVTRTVLAAGRLTWVKNYSVLLRAATHMPDVEVQIIGGGEDEQKLINLARDLGVETRVLFLGRRSREETLRLLAAGDVFVQPSLSEGHSLALIEAAKLHLPLIVSNVPAQIEGVTAKDGTLCGILIDPNDHATLAFEIRRLLDDNLYYLEWAKRSAHLAESSRFDAMLAAYEEVLRDSDASNTNDLPTKTSAGISVLGK